MGTGDMQAIARKAMPMPAAKRDERITEAILPPVAAHESRVGQGKYYCRFRRRYIRPKSRRDMRLGRRLKSRHRPAERRARLVGQHQLEGLVERGDHRKEDLPVRERPHQPPNISFTFVKKPSDSGLVLPALSNSLRSSFCLAVRFTGVSTIISMYMSPRWLERTIGMPLPRRRNWWPLWAPAGMLMRANLASSVGTSMPPPSVACTIESGTLQCTSAPSHSNSAWRRTDRNT